MGCLTVIPKVFAFVGILVLACWIVLYLVMLKRGINNKSNLPSKNVQVPYYAGILNFLKNGGRQR